MVFKGETRGAKEAEFLNLLARLKLRKKKDLIFQIRNYYLQLK